MLLRSVPVASAFDIRQFCSERPDSSVAFGVVTKGNTAQTVTRWTPTFVTVLTDALSQYGCTTRLVPLEFHTYKDALKRQEVDFFFANPTAFQQMKDAIGVHAFLSVRRRFGSGPELDRFGGVLVRNTSRFADVRELADVQRHPGIRICAVNSNAFGGWQIQWVELLRAGVDVASVAVVDYKGSHEAAVRAAIAGDDCDVGVARTGVVETLIAAGEFDADDVFTIGARTVSIAAGETFPQRLSTTLYPEWPLASLPHIPRELEQIMSVPLLMIDPSSDAAIVGKHAGFVFPYSYEPVRQLFFTVDYYGTGACDPGYFRCGGNPGPCEPCTPGSFSDDGVGSCSLCPLGTTNNGSANTDCTLCPPGYKTTKAGSVEGECEPESDAACVAVIVISAAVVSVALLAAVHCSYRLYKSYRKTLAAARAQRDANIARVQRAARSARTCEFLICLIRLEDFMKQCELISHERARDQRLLVHFDTFDEAANFINTHPTIFFSHQWLGASDPDPDGIHFEAMCVAAKAVLQQCGHAAAQVYVWVDFTSVPQRHPVLQRQAIFSLASYASLNTHFVIVAPDTMHTDSKLPCNATTYLERGWCRLEQWAKLSAGGLDGMYLLESGRLVPLSEKQEWLEMSIRVFEGDFTVEGDKHKLVDTVLGLWAQACTSKDDLHDMVIKCKKAVFPKEYFGDLVDIMEVSMANGAFSSKSENDRLTALGNISNQFRLMPGRKRKLHAAKLHSPPSDFQITRSQCSNGSLRRLFQSMAGTSLSGSTSPRPERSVHDEAKTVSFC